jgi:hypothetical protein
MSRKTQITVTDRQYELLHDEAARTGRSVAAVVRGCIDATLRPPHRARFAGWEATLAVNERPDAAIVQRRWWLRRPAWGGGLVEDS